MFKCGLTGHSGILGSEIKKIKNIKFFYFKGNITKIKDVEAWLKRYQFDFIIHLAAVVPTYIAEKNFKTVNSVNFFGTKNLINTILKKQKNLKWFFFASTSHVYKLPYKKIKIKENYPKKPLSKYGITKLRAENYIIKKMEKKIPYCIGRIFSYTHFKQENSYFIPSVYKQIKNNRNPEILFSNLNHFRDFISTEDICYSIKKLWIHRKQGAFNIASSKAINLRSIPSLMKKKLKLQVNIKFKDNKKSTYLVANTNKLKKINSKKKKNFKKILNEFLKKK